MDFLFNTSKATSSFQGTLFEKTENQEGHEVAPAAELREPAQGQRGQRAGMQI